MQTSLPELPFTNYGKAEVDPSALHPSAQTAPRTYPRTDLQTLTPWASFPNDIHQAIQSATTRAHLPLTPFDISGWTMTTIVENEERIRTHATVALHVPVEEVLKMFGVNGRFALPAAAAVVGDPDFLWVVGPAQPHPKVIVEYKAWWVADLVAHLQDAAFTCTRHDPPGPSRQSLDALEQIYGYMTFNNNKFGILTNWQRALFLRRAQTSDRKKTLEYYLVELDGGPSGLGSPISMLKAWVGMVLLAADDWFYVPLPPPPPTLCSAPPAAARNSGTSTAAGRNQRKKNAIVSNAEGLNNHIPCPVNGEYQRLVLDFRMCHFDLSSARRGANGCVVNGRFLQPASRSNDLRVVCKVVDVLRNPYTADILEDEARAYAALQNLQGLVIPTLYGFYELWGILHLLALEPVGNAIREDEQIGQALRAGMKAAPRRVHDAGFVHGDIARRNFCRVESGDVFLVDLERCQTAEDPSEMADEMEEVDRL